jgi:hypothetical protein
MGDGKKEWVSTRMSSYSMDGRGEDFFDRKPVAVVPVEPGSWFGVFGSVGQEVEVVAWVLLETRRKDMPADFPVFVWDGVGIWEDAPEFMGTFSNFQGYRPAGGWNR